MDEHNIAEGKETPNRKEHNVHICCCQINKVLLRFKAHFFLFVGALGTILSFIPVIAKTRLGLSATALAVVLTAQQLITIFSKPIIGYLADNFNKLKLMINTMIATQTACFFLILLVPPIRQVPDAKTSSNILNLFNVNEKNSDYITVSIRPLEYCAYSSENFVSPTLPRIEQNKEKYEENSTCVFRKSKNELLCFQEKKEGDQKESVSQTNKKSCCQIMYTKTDSYEITLKEEEKRSYFRLVPIKHDIRLENVNYSFICTHEKEYNLPPKQASTVNDFETPQYWLFAILLLIAGICGSSIMTLGDTACYESIQKYGGDFGRARLYGAIGWGALGPIGGLLCDVTNDYLAAWILMGTFQLLALWNISYLDLEKPHFSQNILKDVFTVFKSGQFLAFELGVFMNGLGAGILWFYLAWFLTTLGGSKFLCGLAQYVQCFVGEIPFMFFSTWMLKRLGHMNLLSVSLASYGFRFVYYSYLQNPWLVLPTEILHGFTYGTFFPTVVSYGKMNAKPGTEVTTQSILFSLHDGLGAGLGCFVAGIGFDSIGGHQTFLYAGIFFICCTLLNVLNTFITKKRIRTFNLASPSSPASQKY